MIEGSDDLVIKVIHTPGHCEDHVCFYLQNENTLFCGDIILGEGSAVIKDLDQYLNSLENLK